MNSNVKVFGTTEALNESAAQFLTDISKKAVAARGRFLLCLSGGDTPKSLYEMLSLNPYHDLIPWQDIFVFWGDERCVPVNDERNNAFMANEVMLKKVDLPATHIFPIPVGLPPAEAAKKYAFTLKDFFGTEVPRFDLILLGLGENGHTASLFPGTDVIHEQTRWVKEVFVKDQQMHRVTMTAALINKARYVLFLVRGKAKSGILEKILKGAPDPEKYPAQLIHPVPGDLYWYVDDQAASLIKEDQYFL